MFQMQFGGCRLTKKNVRGAKASEGYDVHEYAGIRHIAACRLDTEKVGYGFKTMFDVCLIQWLVP